MNPSSITGLLVVIVAIVWVGVLIPAWSKQGQESERVYAAKNAVKKQVKQVREQARKPLKQASVATLSLRLAQIRMVFGFAMAGGFITALVSLADAAHLWPVTLGGLAITFVSVLITRGATKRHRKVLAASIAQRQRSASVVRVESVMPAEVSSEAIETDERVWTPNPLPKPLHAGHIGNLEQPILAEVKPLSVQPVLRESESTKAPEFDIDEILRRRRNAG